MKFPTIDEQMEKDQETVKKYFQDYKDGKIDIDELETKMITHASYCFTMGVIQKGIEVSEKEKEGRKGLGASDPSPM